MNRRALFGKGKWLPAVPFLGPLAMKAATIAQIPAVQQGIPIASEDAESDAPLLQVMVEDGTEWLCKGAGQWRLDLHDLPDYITNLTKPVAYIATDNPRFIAATGEYGRRVAEVVWLALKPVLEREGANLAVI